MATIISFRAGGPRPESASRPSSGAGAEIVIFPGVRYEYHPEPGRPPDAVQARGRKRDRLEIAD